MIDTSLESCSGSRRTNQYIHHAQYCYTPEISASYTVLMIPGVSVSKASFPMPTRVAAFSPSAFWAFASA